MNFKTVKKILSVILLITVLGTTLTVFSGCGLFTDDLFAKKIKGTEAAEILLARERLDADSIGQRLAIFSTSSSAQAEAQSTGGSDGSFFEKLFPFGKIGISPIAKTLSRLAKIAPGATVGNDTVEWRDFKKTSDLRTNYSQFIDPIDNAAAKTAELIATIKEDVGVTDKWVDTLNSKYMLIVDESSETIIEYYKPYDSISVSTRYTRDDAKCVYEMYSFISYEDGTTGDIRNKCIPGEYYEYACKNSGGFTDYFIADKSNGYWITNRFQIKDIYNEAFFDMSAIKDGIGFGTAVTATQKDGKLIPLYEDISVSMFLPDDDVDIFEIHTAPDRYNITLFLSNVESGIEYLSANRSTIWEEQYGNSGMVYLYGTGGDMSNTVDIHLSNGNTLRVGDGNGKVTYNDARVSYSPEYHYDAYVGRLTFEVKGSSEKEIFDNFYAFLSENGITLRVDEAKTLTAFEMSKQLNENFDVMNWYGLRLDSLDNLLEGEDLLEKDFANYRALYENVKNNETISVTRKYAPADDFGAMSITDIGKSTYANGIISVKGLSARSDATDLLENGKAYTLKVGLALRDDEGNISSVNAVPLESDDQQTVEFNGRALELTQSADFTVPAALSEGNYVVVIYFATADEGIRVTEMFPVAFFSAEEGTLDSDVMDVTVSRSGDNLFIDYAIKLSEYTVADVVKSEYTYEDIERVLIRGVLAKGYPINDAIVENERGEALAENGKFGSGTYRLRFLVNTSEGLVEAYMYCAFGTN